MMNGQTKANTREIEAAGSKTANEAYFDNEVVGLPHPGKESMKLPSSWALCVFLGFLGWQESDLAAS